MFRHIWYPTKWYQSNFRKLVPTFQLLHAGHYLSCSTLNSFGGCELTARWARNQSHLSIEVNNFTNMYINDQKNHLDYSEPTTHHWNRLSKSSSNKFLMGRSNLEKRLEIYTRSIQIDFMKSYDRINCLAASLLINKLITTLCTWAHWQINNESLTQEDART